jgi:hypothetical protein
MFFDLEPPGTSAANVGGALGPQLDHGTIVGDEFARIDGAK